MAKWNLSEHEQHYYANPMHTQCFVIRPDMCKLPGDFTLLAAPLQIDPSYHILHPDFTHMSKDTRFYSILLYCNWQKAWAACSLAKYREEGGKSKEERLIEERGEEKGRGYHCLWLLSGYSSENWNPGLGHFCFSVSGIHNLQLLYIRVLNETSTEDCSEFIH